MCELCELCEQLTNISKQLIVNMQLRWFFSTFIAFFSDFVHFTLKLFKILYYLCTRIRHLSRIADTAPLNRRATKASALPQKPRFSGAPKETHRTLIALSQRYHRTHVQVQPRSGVPVAPRRIPVACGVKKIRTRFSRLNKIFYSTTRNNFGNFEKFCSI